MRQGYLCRLIVAATFVGRAVNLGWILLGLIGWALGFGFVLLLMRMSGQQDRAARHEQKRMDPFSDVTITRTGVG
jgi:hypothetical protein